MAKSYVPYDGPVVTREEAKAQGLKRFFTGEPCIRSHISEYLVSSNGCLVCSRVLRRSERPNDVMVKAKSTADQGRLEARDKGEMHYNGTPCNKCGATLRYVNSCACVACGRAHALYQRTSNPEGFKEYIKKHRKTYDYIPTDTTKAKDKARRGARYRSERSIYNLYRLLFIAYNFDLFEDALAEAEAEKERNIIAKRIANAEGSRKWRCDNPEKRAAADRNKKANRKGAPGKHTKADIMRIGNAQKWKCGWCRSSIKNDYHVDHVKPLSKGGTNWPNNLLLSCPSCNMRKKTKDPIDWAQSLGRLI